MNSVAHPLREISVPNLANLLGIFIPDQLLQVVVIQVLLLSEVPENVLNCYVAVVVRVQRQKRFPD